MGFNINDMVARYSDFARAYLFYAQISVSPVSIPVNHPYLVSSTSLPAQTIEPIDTNWQGLVYSFGGTNTFEDFTVTFKCDTGQDLRSQFINWMYKIHNPETNVHGNPAEYFGIVGLSQLSVDGTPIMKYDLINAWPTSVGEITLDYSSKEVSTFDVTFKYTYHTIAAIDGSEGAMGAEVA